MLLRAYYERPNFYSAAVYIAQSTGSLMVRFTTTAGFQRANHDQFLINLALIVAASVGYGLQRLFYGPLRPIETEQLYDKAWFAVSETLLAMTIFRDDIGLWFFTMFLCLLGGKVWQWIGEGRVEFVEQQPPANPWLFHNRLMASLAISVAFDVFMLLYCVDSALDSLLKNARPGVMVMFGFEYMLLSIASVSTMLRYVLVLVEIVVTHRQEQVRAEARRVAREQARQQAAAAEGEGVAAPEEEDDDDGEVPGWEEKGRWLFILDLTTDFLKLIVYLGFFGILILFNGLPLHIFRDLYLTFRSFIKRIHDFIQYRNATRDMNRYPDATAEDLERDNTCIVCREEMQPWLQPGGEGAQAGRRVDERQRAKKLPCGHILHFSCLRSWLERQQVCPICRRPVLAPAIQPENQQNQQNPGPLNQPNPAPLEGGGFRGIFPGNFGNAQQPAAAPPAQPMQQAPQGGQPNRPAGNVRVFNIGPLRIALGNLLLPPRNQQGNGNLDVDQIARHLARQMAERQNPPAAGHPTLPAIPAIPGAMAQHPADIQSDILRLQHNIIESLRQLNAQQDQLEYIHALLAELNRLQQASGAAAATGQELPPIAPLDPQHGFAPMVPQAFFANGPVLRPGDAGLPDGLVLPEGWSLRPMALAPRPGTQLPTQAPQPEPSQANLQPEAKSSTARPASSSEPPAASSPAAGSSSKPGEPSSLESSWSFGNVPGSHETEGSSSAVAGSSSAGQHVTRRTVTVEEAEDEGR